MTSNLLALDIDGVLNSLSYRIHMDEIGQTLITPRHMDPENVKILLSIFEECNFDVVISSTWRMCYSLKEIMECLCEHGFDEKHQNRFVGVTDRKWPPAGEAKGRARGLQIQRFLDANPQYSNLVILDDDDDMAHLINNLVLTDYRYGLTNKEANKIKALFGKIDL